MFVVLVSTLIIIPLTSKEDYTRYNVTLALLYAILGFFFLMAFGMSVTLVASLKSRITKLSQENTNLFNKMHEGLIVVTKANLIPIFSNKPAIALFEQGANEGSFDAQRI